MERGKDVGGQRSSGLIAHGGGGVPTSNLWGGRGRGEEGGSSTRTGSQRRCSAGWLAGWQLAGGPELTRVSALIIVRHCFKWRRSTGPVVNTNEPVGGNIQNH